jgi:2'-5' RNA ligase
MRLRLAGVGHFGSDVMWVGVRGDITALSHLAMSAATAGRQMGIEQGYRRFRPHVTLARGTSPADRHQYVHLLATYRGPDWTAEKITLLESHLTPNQAREPKYESVGHFALTKD